ncbi:MAG: VCBS repeat-containing protein [bacterium]|nr:VCBS repeat-containing protein [bacterium]
MILKNCLRLGISILLVLLLFSGLPGDAVKASETPAQSTTGPVPPKDIDTSGHVFADDAAEAATTISGVPAYIWHRGCGPTAVGMVVGYYDGNGYPDLIPGDASTQGSSVDAAIASTGNYDDYCLPIDSYPNMLLDKSEAPAGDEHTDNCIADFMYTSRSANNNYYGWSYSNHIKPSFENYMALVSSYTGTCTYYYYNNFSFAQLQTEIDNNRPMLTLVDTDGNGGTDHFVPIIGYNTISGTDYYACLNTWDSSIHWYEYRKMNSGRPWGIYCVYTFQMTSPPQSQQSDYMVAHGGNFDGTTGDDIAIFRPSNGRWCVRGQASVAWGTADDTPVPGDYNGDGTTDIAIYRSSTGRWCIQGQASIAWGTSTDIPVPGDYDGDGSTDIAIYRPSTGRWCIRGQASVAYGTATDIPVPGDYDGDGDTDIAIFRPSTGRWCVQGQASVAWGTSSDVPVPGDYDGDGDTDIAIFRPSTGRWCVLGQASVAWGTSSDTPVPGDYDGDGDTDIAIFRSSNGRWCIRGQASVAWGVSSDIPLISHYQ